VKDLGAGLFIEKVDDTLGDAWVTQCNTVFRQILLDTLLQGHRLKFQLDEVVHVAVPMDTTTEREDSITPLNGRGAGSPSNSALDGHPLHFAEV